MPERISKKMNENVFIFFIDIPAPIPISLRIVKEFLQKRLMEEFMIQFYNMYVRVPENKNCSRVKTFLYHITI